LGQKFAFMPDVSGYDFKKLWGDFELSAAHKMMKWVAGRKGLPRYLRKTQNQDFKNHAAFTSAFGQDFAVAGEEGVFSYIENRCDMNLYLHEQGEPKTRMTIKEIFKGRKAAHKLRNFTKLLNNDNVCLFLA